MSIISFSERKSAKGRLLMAAIYLLLILGGCTMVYPFAVMVTGSLSNSLDYERRSALPRFVWSREDRFMRTLADRFPAGHRDSMLQLRSFFPDLPADWQNWTQAGDDVTTSDRWARKQLGELSDPRRRQCLESAARDYAEFARTWSLAESTLAFRPRYVAPFLRDRYRSIERFNRAWEMSVDDFSQVTCEEWLGEPLDQQSYVPDSDVRYRDFLAFRDAFRHNRYSRNLEGAPAGYLRPACLRYTWEMKLAEHRIADAADAEFPVGPRSSPRVRMVWREYVATDLPLRHIRIDVTDTHRISFRQFLARRFKSIEYYNRVVGASVKSWEDVDLPPTVPQNSLARVWLSYVNTSVPIEHRKIRGTLPDLAFQDFAIGRHGSLRGVNRAYGLELKSIRQLRIPYRAAALVTFARYDRTLMLDGLRTNYAMVLDYLLHRGRAVPNTLLLVALTMFLTLTINPLAGYALSRFRLKWSEHAIVFCLVTMAFPAAVAVIPGFLLLRDLHLLNTYWALVLPGAANGMSIFLLKGFFDSIPRELYEAATIDGASEWQVFWRISLPLVKPILAVNLLSAFVVAYNGWEWAIVVCQNPDMWTVAVWTYQFFQKTGAQPPVMAAFVINSLPVLIVFILCQKVIMRGIILPQMK